MNERCLSEFWEYLSANLPNYYTRDDVLRSDILFRYYTDEAVSDDDLAWINDEFGGDNEAIRRELIRLETQFASEAIRNFYNNI